MEYGQKKERTVVAYPPKPLIAKMDSELQRTGTSRSSFITDAIREKLERIQAQTAATNRVSAILS